MQFLLTTFILLCLLITGSCTTPIPSSTPDQVRKPFIWDDTLLNTGKTFVINSSQSSIGIFVYRGGLLAALGHHHVIRAGNINGQIFLADKLPQSGLMINLPVADFIVDDTTDRQKAMTLTDADFSSIPTAKDIAGTRRNILSDRLLDEERYPEIRIHSLSPNASPDLSKLSLRIYLKNNYRDIEVPVKLQITRETIRTRGNISLLQSDFGLMPFSILAGAIAVQDRMDIHFDLIAYRKNTE